jgi:tetratricopeptide (TPR) repeat protein
VAEAKAFSRAASDLYLVTRLDGYTARDVAGLIDRGAAPVREGQILLDQKAGVLDGAGNEWLTTAADRLAKGGFARRVVLETTSTVLSGRTNVLGYYDWAITTRRLGLSFVPGAIAGMYVSTDGRTFTEPPAAWTIGRWTDRTSFFAGSPQSLAGDLIREGVTGVAAHVAEPFLDATVRPDILFPAYVSGFNLAESFYLAMPYLSWQTVVVGDPLCAPVPRRPVQPADIDGGIDPATELPALFAARRLQLLARSTTPEAAKAVLRSEARAAKGDRPGVLKALEEATALDPKLAAAHMMLASGYEAQQDYDKAVERYRAVLAASPDHAIALNNLAYALAVHRGQAAEALGFAERAVALTNGRSPEIADTLAWVQHLLGRDREASEILQRIVRAAPERAEYRMHLAAVYAAVGKLEEAATELREAVRLDPELEKSNEVKALRARLGR